MCKTFLWTFYVHLKRVLIFGQNLSLMASVKQLIKNIADFFEVNEKELREEFLSDQIAYKVLEEEADLNILKVAEEKVAYIKTLRNE